MISLSSVKQKSPFISPKVFPGFFPSSFLIPPRRALRCQFPSKAARSATGLASAAAAHLLQPEGALISMTLHVGWLSQGSPSGGYAHLDCVLELSKWLRRRLTD